MDSTEFLKYVKDSPVERQRYLTLRGTLAGFAQLFRGRSVLDYGASYALSMCALIELGAASVVGIEPDPKRVARGNRILTDLKLGSRATLHEVADTTRLPMDSQSVDVVIANAVLEHIPQPRTSHITEMWRVLAEGGYLIINETPNKYLPVDFHTTKLALVPWLPTHLARRYALWRGRFSAQEDWASSGWRGVGFYEITHALPRPFRYHPEVSRPRHRVLTRLGLPASLLDPYPTLIFQKG